MSRLEKAVILLLLVCLVLSSASLGLWASSFLQAPEKWDYFSVNVNCGADYYRLYVQRNGITLIATEDVGIHLYPFNAQVGDTISILAYSNVTFSLEFSWESPHALIQSEIGQTISIERIAEKR